MRMADFCIGQYQDIFLQTGTLLDDVVASYNKKTFSGRKAEPLLCYTGTARILCAGTLAPAIRNGPRRGHLSGTFSKECIQRLRPLKTLSVSTIPVEHTIAVGDSDNDMEILKTAGLSVAMGNARPHIKELSDVDVADNDHGGCAEAIYEYLLKNNYSFVHIHDRTIRVTRIGIASENNIYTA